MEEFISFVKLFLDDGSSSLAVVAVLLFGNSALYMLDFYSLVKRKSTMETFSVMMIPWAVSLVGADYAAMFVHVSNLEKFGAALQSRSLNIWLVLIVVLYLFLWGITFFSFGAFSVGSFALKKRKREDTLRWLLSGIPDYCFATVILLCSGWCAISGRSLFESGRELLLWIYLYALYLLSCKIILMVVALLIRLYSVRITLFKWKEGKNPSAFLFRYFVFYQNAVFRNLLLFGLGLLIPFTLKLDQENWTYEVVCTIGPLWAGMVVVILFGLTPAMNALHKFRAWGEPRSMKELFCREYFAEEPIYKNEEYTLTRHFLIDTQSAAMVYYWPLVKSVSGWVVDKKGKNRTICFSDGTNCRISGEETKELSPIFEYAKKWQEGNIYPYKKDSAVLDKMDSPYEDFIRNLLFIIILIIAMSVQGVRN